MTNMMKHGDYIATIEFDPKLGEFFGEVLNTSDVITFYGASVKELQREFANSIEAHVEFCKKHGVEPSRPYSGKFIVRLDPQIHAFISAAAHMSGTSMNAWIEAALRRAAERVLEISPAALASARSTRGHKRAAKRRA